MEVLTDKYRRELKPKPINIGKVIVFEQFGYKKYNINGVERVNWNEHEKRKIPAIILKQYFPGYDICGSNKDRLRYFVIYLEDNDDFSKGAIIYHSDIYAITDIRLPKDLYHKLLQKYDIKLRR